MRVQRYASLLAASLMAIVPVNAFGQTVPYYQDYDRDVSVRNRPRPEYDPMGLRLGGFDLNARLDLSVTSTDNLFASGSPFEEDDIYFDVTPFARLASHWSRHALGAEAGANFRSHDEFSSEDAETYFVRGFGRLDVGSNSSLAASAGFAHEVEPRTDPDAPSVGAPVEYDRTDASLTAQHNFNRFRLTGMAAFSEYDYDGFQSFRDNDVTLFRGRVEAEVTPRIGLLLQAETDERDYTNSPALSSEGQTYLAGVVLRLTDLMRGEVAVGQFEREYDGPPAVTVDGTAVAANLEWYVTRLTTLNFNARRNSEDVIGGTTLEPYVATSYGARVDHELLRNVILTAGAQAGTREYETIDRDDDFVYADAGVDYLVNRRVVVRGRYRFDQVESDGTMAYRDYEVNAFTLGVSLRL